MQQNSVYLSLSSALHVPGGISPIIRSSLHCIYSNGHMNSRYCGYSVMSSRWWVKYHRKHVEQLTDLNKLYTVASSWIIITIYYAMHGPLKLSFLVLKFCISICDWKTVEIESVWGDVLGTLRPREGVTWCCADRRTRRQLKARSRYFGNSSDRNSWGAGTRCRQTITASHRLLNYPDLPVFSSQEVKHSLLFFFTTLAVSQTTWHGMVRLGQKWSPGGTDETPG